LSQQIVFSYCRSGKPGLDQSMSRSTINSFQKSRFYIRSTIRREEIERRDHLTVRPSIACLQMSVSLFIACTDRTVFRVNKVPAFYVVITSNLADNSITTGHKRTTIFCWNYTGTVEHEINHFYTYKLLLTQQSLHRLTVKEISLTNHCVV